MSNTNPDALKSLGRQIRPKNKSMISKKEVNQIKSVICDIHGISVLVIVGCWEIWHLAIALLKR